MSLRNFIIAFAAALATLHAAGVASALEPKYITAKNCEIQFRNVAPVFCIGHGGFKTCRWNYNYTVRRYSEFTVLYRSAVGRSTVWGVVTTPSGRLMPVHVFTGPSMTLPAFYLYAREQVQLARSQEWEWGCLEPRE